MTDVANEESIDDGSELGPEFYEEGIQADSEFSKDELERLLEEDAEKTQMPAAIPIGRFNEVNAKWREEQERSSQLQSELDRLRQPPSQREAPPPFDLAEKEAEYLRLLMDEFDSEGAAKLRNEINQHLMAIAQEQALKAFSDREIQRRKQQEEQAAITVAEKLIEEHPFINQDSPDFNPEALDDFGYWRDKFLVHGKPLIEALTLAAGKVASLYSGNGPQKDDDDAKRPDPRQEKALRRGLEDAKRQPPAPGGIGARALDASEREITEKAVASMTEEEKARERGDFA